MTQMDFMPDDGPVFEIHEGTRNVEDVMFARASVDNLAQIVDWIEDSGHHAVLGNGQVIIQSLDGPATIRPGDYVIRGKRGEFYRCDSEVFSEDYGDYGPVEA
jgi:hypothetical protein